MKRRRSDLHNVGGDTEVLRDAFRDMGAIVHLAADEPNLATLGRCFPRDAYEQVREAVNQVRLLAREGGKPNHPKWAGVPDG